MVKFASLVKALIEYEMGCPHRAGHFLKVHGYAKAIGELEGLNEDMMLVVETAALIHDVGIKPSIKKYGSSAGEYQQMEGPPIARRMLTELGYSEGVIERVCSIVARHHTFTDIDGLDFQILVEADFLVNIEEDNLSLKSAQSLLKNIFKTEAGKLFLEQLYINS